MQWNPMSLLPGVVVGGVVASQMAYFGRIRENISQLCNVHLTYVANIIPFPYSRAYGLHLGVPTVLDIASDTTDVAVKT